MVDRNLTDFNYLGRLLAVCLIKDIPIEINLTLSFLKHITKEDLYIADLDDIDPELSRSL